MERARILVRRGLRILVGTVGILLAIVVLGVLSLLLPPVRERVLAMAVNQAQARLPGEFAVEEAAWPSLGSIALTGVVWTDSGDTLVAVDTLAVAMDLGALLRRELHARRLVLTGVVFDLPALQAAFPPSPSGPPDADTEGKESTFPRDGSLPGVPSVAADEVVVRASRATLSPTRTLVDVEIAGGCDLSRAGGPRMTLSRLTARAPDESIWVEANHLAVDGVAGKLDGELSARLDSLGTLSVRLASTRERLDLIATLEPVRAGPALRIEFQGRPSWDGKRLRAIEFTAEFVVPGTEELAAWPAPVAKVADISPLGPVPAHAEGVLTLRPRFEIQGRVETEPAGWLEHLELEGSYSEEVIEVDTLRVVVPGLRAAASGRWTEDSVIARLDATVTDARWLATMSPGIDPPDSLAALVHASLTGSPRDPETVIDLTGGYRKGTLAVREAKVTARFPHGPKEPGTVDVSAVYRELRVRTRAALAVRTPLDIEVSPIQVVSTKLPESPGSLPSNDRGRFRFDPKSGALQAEGIQLFGDLGNGRLGGELHHGSGTATMEWAFPEPPPILRTVIVLPDSSWDSLRVRWSADGPFVVRSRARFGDPAGSLLRCEGDFKLPGPRSLREFLPAGARVDDLGAISARFTGGIDTLAGGTAWTATLDLDSTSWIEASPIRVGGSSAGIAADSLRVAVEGSSLYIGGGRSEGGWNARGSLELSDARLVRRFVPSWSDEDSCSVLVEASLSGENPDLSIRFRGKGRYQKFQVAGLTGGIARKDGIWDLRIGMNEGLPGSELILSTRAVLDRREGWSLRADTLGISAAGKDLQSRGPFRIIAPKDGTGIQLEHVDLEGTLGTLRGNGYLRPGDSELDFQLKLDLEDVSPPPRWMPGLWPDHVKVSLRNQGPTAVMLEAEADGLALAGTAGYAIDLSAQTDTAAIQGEVHLRSPEKEVLRGDFSLPGTLQPYPLRIQITPRGVRSRWTMDELPIPWEIFGLDRASMFPATLSGNVRADSDASGPFARADLTVLVQSPQDDGAPVRFSSQAVWIAAPSQRALAAGDSVALSEVNEKHLRDLTGPGLTASFSLDKAETPELTGSLLAPFRETSDHRYAVDPDRGIDLIASAPGLDLADLNAFLPAESRLTGTLAIEITLRGSPKNPTLGGHVDAPKVELEFKDGGRAVGKGKLQYSGTLLAPNVRGKIEVTNALLPIPETPRKLHPPAGEAHLWKGQGRATAVPDTAVGGAQGKAAKPDSAGAGAFRPDYDLTIVVPSGVWIRGRNLNVELGGDLRLRHEDGHPTVIGTLEARQGTMTFLGRSFQLDRGKVQFYGEDELDPALDVRLSAKVSSTSVYVSVSGTAREPKIELTSSPSLSEADIMSLLVMGKTSEDLEGDQAELVAQRAAAIAATYGAAELEKNLAGPLGVDMITLNPGGGPEGESSVVVGKYLSPRTLIKYEQAIDSAAGFFVTLQYTLTQTITLETIAGTWQSGAEISWSKDY